MKNSFFYQTALVALTLASFNAHAKYEAPVQGTDTKTRICQSPRSKVYAADTAFDKLEVTLLTDYATLNTLHKGDGQTVRGVLRVFNKAKNVSEIQPVVLSARGNSRGDSCEAPPFRMQFLKEEIKTNIETSLTGANISPDQAEYLKEYYKQLSAAPINTQSDDIASVEKGILAHLGDDIKVVTHCGKSKDWDMIGGADEASQNERLLAEYTIYKLLDTLKLPVEATRLVNLMYLNSDGTPAYTRADGTAATKLAFFREPPKSIGARCGLLSKLDPNTNYPNSGTDDQDSVNFTNFINNFVLNADYGLYGHNMNILYDVTGKSVHGAYDFDLSGIIKDGYFKNASDFKYQSNKMMQHLKSSPRDSVLPIVSRVVEQESAMKSIIAASEVSGDMKARFMTWFAVSFPELKAFLTAQ